MINFRTNNPVVKEKVLVDVRVHVPGWLWTVSSLSELTLVEVVSLRPSLDLGEDDVVHSSHVRRGKTRAVRLGR